MQTLVEGSKPVMVAFYKAAHQVLDSMGMVAGRFTDKIRLARCDVTKNPWATSEYQLTTDPTFLVFKSGAIIRRMSGVGELITSLPDLIGGFETPAGGAPAGASKASDSSWLGAPISVKNYLNITQSIELSGLDILNANTSLGGARALFEASKPSGKGADGVESDTDEQLMLYVPFQAPVKLHSIHITSLASANEDDDDEAPSRPRIIKLFCNTHQILGFEDAEEREATQMIELKPEDWKDGTAVVMTKFVKFQSCSAFTMFFVEAERSGAEKIRIDRIRVIGERMAEKMDMNKLKQQEE